MNSFWKAFLVLGKLLSLSQFYAPKWTYNVVIADQCKQRMELRHIGLVKDYDGHLVNQPRYSAVRWCIKLCVLCRAVSFHKNARKDTKYLQHQKYLIAEVTQNPE